MPEIRCFSNFQITIFIFRVKLTTKTYLCNRFNTSLTKYFLGMFILKIWICQFKNKNHISDLTFKHLCKELGVKIIINFG